MSLHNVHRQATPAKIWHDGAVRLSLVAAGCLAVAVAAPVLAQSPHTPTEEELSRRLSGIHHDAERQYQARSADTLRSKARRAANWVRAKLSRVYVTPARLALGLGILGVLYGRGKNRRKIRWMIVLLASGGLAVFGLAAMIFDWPYVN